jgi:hypothetical protein
MNGNHPILNNHLSPSLRAKSAGGLVAREFKFLLPYNKAQKLESLANACMELDPHCSPDATDGQGRYQVQSVYLDTPEQSILHRAMGLRNIKYRLRRYALGSTLFLERKSKLNAELEKKRIVADMGCLSKIDEHIDKDPIDSVDWFVSDVQRLRLRPACVVQYQRRAYYIDSDLEPLRMTLDFDLSSKDCLSNRFSEIEWSDGIDGLKSARYRPGPLQFVIGDQVIMELKFFGSLPSLFKLWMIELEIAPIRFSKYRTAMSSYSCYSEVS